MSYLDARWGHRWALRPCIRFMFTFQPLLTVVRAHSGLYVTEEWCQAEELFFPKERSWHFRGSRNVMLSVLSFLLKSTTYMVNLCQNSTSTMQCCKNTHTGPAWLGLGSCPPPTAGRESKFGLVLVTWLCQCLFIVAPEWWYWGWNRSLPESYMWQYVLLISALLRSHGQFTWPS